MIRIRFTPNRRVMNKFKAVVKNDIERMGVLARSRRSINNFWKNHIYEYFNARVSHGLPVSGQLGNSLIIKINKSVSSLEFFMKPLHNDRTVYTVFRFTPFRMPSGKLSFSMPTFSMGMGTKLDLDYGKLLRQGFSQSNNGRYDFTKDCKVKPGSHPGYNASSRWVPWKKLFDRETRKIIVRNMTNELKRAGVNIRRIKI